MQLHREKYKSKLIHKYDFMTYLLLHNCHVELFSFFHTFTVTLDSHNQHTKSKH